MLNAGESGFVTGLSPVAEPASAFLAIRPCRMRVCELQMNHRRSRVDGIRAACLTCITDPEDEARS